MNARPDEREQAVIDRTWCAIPVFNNRTTVRDIAVRCRAIVPRVVVVDDGSTDADVADLLCGTDITVLRHDGNRGKGQAIKTALTHVRDRGGEFMVTVDADGQHDPADMRRFWAILADDPATIVIGARRMDGPNVPRASRFGMRFSDVWLRLETGLDVCDSQSGFRAYPVGLVGALDLRGDRYDLEVEVLAKGAWAGLAIRSVEVGVTYAEKGRRVSHFRPFLDNLRITHRHVMLVGRRLMPWPYRRLVRRESPAAAAWLRHPVRFFRELLLEHATPAELGGAAAVGVFIATLPILSLHTVLILYVATRLRLNRVMAVVIQNLCMPPFVPFVCIEVGHFLRHGRWLKEMTRETWIHQAPLRLWEWLLGSLVLAPVLAAVTGVLVFFTASVLAKRVVPARKDVPSGEGGT